MNAQRLLFALPLIAFSPLVQGCEKASSGTSGPPPTAPTVSTVDGGADPQTGEVRYLALGDSISQGVGSADIEAAAFPTRLAERWRTRGCKVDVKNVAASGNTTNDIIAAQLPELAPFKPTFISLQVGANDIATGVPIETYRTNLTTILDAAKKSGARVITLSMNDWPRSPEGPNYGTGLGDKRIAYDAVLIEETKAKGAEFIDLRLLYQQHADKKMWAEDGLHPTVAAYDEMAAEIARVIPSPCGK
ncbi:hypothetical protein BH11MYX4_BH11MYX4_03360 [soil metagenome]